MKISTNILALNNSKSNISSAISESLFANWFLNCYGFQTNYNANEKNILNGSRKHIPYKTNRHTLKFSIVFPRILLEMVLKSVSTPICFRVEFLDLDCNKYIFHHGIGFLTNRFYVNSRTEVEIGIGLWLSIPTNNLQ